MIKTPVSTQVTRVVKPGHEEAFEQSLRSFFQNIGPIPGQLSVHVVRPLAGSASREWGILRTFESEQHRQDFYNSQVFQQYDAEAARFTEGERVRQDLTGLETWFSVGRPVAPPPRWKMGIVSFVGVYPTSLTAGALMGALLPGAPGTVKVFLGTLLTVVGLTWLVMPALARLFQRWLYPGTK